MRKARMSEDTRNSLIGAMTCIVLATFFALGYSEDPDKHNADGYRVYSIFEDADGIGAGSPVLMAGIPIGDVRTMRLLKDTNEALVEIIVRNEFEIPIDSEVAIISDGIAGGKYIRVLPGGEFDMMVEDDYFDYAQNSISFIDLFERIVLMGEAQRGIEPSVE